jgi:hypothetical protein
VKRSRGGWVHSSEDGSSVPACLGARAAAEPALEHAPLARRLPRPSRDVLCGRSLRLRHGWVGVVNRGQADINKKMNMSEARAREAEFFKVGAGGGSAAGALGAGPAAAAVERCSTL